MFIIHMENYYYKKKLLRTQIKKIRKMLKLKENTYRYKVIYEFFSF